MNEFQNDQGRSLSPAFSDQAIHGRIFRAMEFTTAAAVILSLPFAQWRITTGLLLGGVLALLNHRWLSNSTAATFSVLVAGVKPRLRILQYLLRYFVVATVVISAYKLDVVSLTATLIGLSSFVVALFAEACREFYFAIIHREEIS